VLSVPQFLVPRKFQADLQPLAKETQFALFLVNQRPVTTQGTPVGGCGATKGGRTQEAPKLDFRRVTSLIDWDTKQLPPDVRVGPDDTMTQDRPVFLGVATWDGKTFTKFDKDDALVGMTAYRRRYLGVRADSMESIGGRLALRTAPAGTAAAPLIQVDPNDDNPLTFGLDDGKGSLKPLLQVNRKGDLTVTGKLAGAADIKKGEFYVESGRISDGLRVPLPPGIDDPQVASGAVTLHIQITPRPEASRQPVEGDFSPPLAASTADDVIPRVIEATVDENRRVSCLIRWLSTKDLTKSAYLPGVCDYLILAAISADTEASS
jgi:hypothetical protein